MVIIVTCLLTTKSSISLKPITKNVNFPTQFCRGGISNKLGAVESREVSFKGNVYDFSVDYNASDKYLMVKHDIKQCSGFLNKCLSFIVSVDL